MNGDQLTLPKQPKTWTKEEIAQKLLTDDRWLYRALLTLYARQTEFEQVAGETRAKNGVGFTTIDAEWLTIMAKKLKEQGFLTPKQKQYVRFTRKGGPRIVKYAAQLAKLAKEKALAQPMAVAREMME